MLTNWRFHSDRNRQTVAPKILLTGTGGDPQPGARPLNRTIPDRILNPLPLRLLEGEFKPGDKIKVTTNWFSGANKRRLSFLFCRRFQQAVNWRVRPEFFSLAQDRVAMMVF